MREGILLQVFVWGSAGFSFHSPHRVAQMSVRSVCVCVCERRGGVCVCVCVKEEEAFATPCCSDVGA